MPPDITTFWYVDAQIDRQTDAENDSRFCYVAGNS